MFIPFLIWFHRQHLIARNLSERLFQSLQYVIKAVNKIWNSSLIHRLFNQLSVANDEDVTRLLFHTEVRWLSRGNCLVRFYNLFDSVIEFLENKDTKLSNNLMKSKNDIAYLTDLYKLFNDINLQLQGDDLNLIKTKNVAAAFVAKFLLYKKNIGRREFHNFPKLSLSCNNDDLFVYCQHLDNLHSDFIEPRYFEIKDTRMGVGFIFKCRHRNIMSAGRRAYWIDNKGGAKNKI